MLSTDIFLIVGFAPHGSSQSRAHTHTRNLEDDKEAEKGEVDGKMEENREFIYLFGRRNAECCITRAAH